MNTTTLPSAPAPASAPAKPSKALLAARRLADDKKKLADEVSRLTAQKQSLEADYLRIERDITTDTAAASVQRRDPDETLALELKKVGADLAPVYAALEKQQAALHELNERSLLQAPDALRSLYPLAVQTANELQRLGEIESRLQAEKATLERDCDPEDEAKLKELEGVCLRLTVIPGKKERWEEKLASQVEELIPFWIAARHALRRAVAARHQLARDKFRAVLAPFFAGQTLPASVEMNCEKLFDQTSAYSHWAQIEQEGCAHRLDSDFDLAAVPPLLSAFEAIAQLEKA